MGLSYQNVLQNAIQKPATLLEFTLQFPLQFPLQRASMRHNQRIASGDMRHNQAKENLASTPPQASDTTTRHRSRSRQGTRKRLADVTFSHVLQPLDPIIDAAASWRAVRAYRLRGAMAGGGKNCFR